MIDDAMSNLEKPVIDPSVLLSTPDLIESKPPFQAGHFEIDECVPLPQDAPPKRVGASAAEYDRPAGDGESADVDFELPLVTWLRGDESFFAEFDLDADGVMARLGIKRSRLTQISGKELRVGRVRVDRYIKPIYRSKDVEAYVNWTRASASHLKSSSVLAAAAGSLHEQTLSFAHAVEDTKSQFVKSLEETVLVPMRNAFQQNLNSIAKELEAVGLGFNDDLLKNQQATSNIIAPLALEITQLKAIAATQESTLEQLALRISDLQDRILILTESQEKLYESVSILIDQQNAAAQTPENAKSPPRRKSNRRPKQTIQTQEFHPSNSETTPRFTRPHATRKPLPSRF